MLKNICKYRYLLKEIVRKNIKLQYRNHSGSFLDISSALSQRSFWCCLFTDIRKDSSAVLNYPVYLLAGVFI